MGHVSRPLVGLLIATVVFFALWLIALKPSSSSNSGGSLGQYQSAINAARKAVTTSNNSNAASAGEAARATTTASTANGPSSVTTTKVSSSPHPAKATAPTTPKARLSAVQRALVQKKVLALLFYNPAAPDDNAVKQELSSISTHHGQVVKLEIPLNELPNYTVVISQVPVNFSPTLVIIDRAQQAQEITGFTDSYEIEQRLDQALLSGATVG